MMREIGELESVGDACYNIARVLNRKLNGKESFTEGQLQGLNTMMELVDKALKQMTITLKGHKSELDINNNYNLEHEINNYRDALKNKHIIDMDNRSYSYSLGSMYMDIVNECEKLGDYIMNVIEARFGK